MILNKPFPYNSSYKLHLIIALILGFLLSYILIILQPFNLNKFDHTFKDVLLIGFGFLKFLNYLLAHVVENYFYKKKGNWTLWNEIIFHSLSSLSGIILAYLYLDIVFEKQPISFQRLALFFYHIALPLFLIIVLLKSALRYLFITKSAKDVVEDKVESVSSDLEKIILKGENNKDELSVLKNQILYIKSIDNYVSIFYVDTTLKSKMIRATLSDILLQAPFLIKPHRSYLVNPKQPFKIEGNSQKATLNLSEFKVSIPLSRALYKAIKKVFN